MSSTVAAKAHHSRKPTSASSATANPSTKTHSDSHSSNTNSRQKVATYRRSNSSTTTSSSSSSMTRNLDKKRNREKKYAAPTSNRKEVEKSENVGEVNDQETAGATKKASNGSLDKRKSPAAVLVGLPEGPIPTEEDTDIYATKLGGKPIWFNERPQESEHSAPCCGHCSSRLFLVMQAYCPLEESPYHRVIYVWGCNRRKCMREKGSWKVFRGHRLDGVYQKQLEEKKIKLAKKKADQALKKKKQTEQRRPLLQSTDGATAGASFASGFGDFSSGGISFGDLWNPDVTVKAIDPNELQDDESYAVEETCDIENESQNLDAAIETSLSTPNQYEETHTLHETLVVKDEMRGLASAMEATLIGDNVSEPTHGPIFPPYYLYVSNEDSESDDEDTISAHIRRAAAYEMNMNLDDDDSTDSGGHNPSGGNPAVWSGESYEKAALPKGMDKTLQKFMRRVSRHSSQCVRYDARSQGGSGMPLLYSLTDPTGQHLTRVPGGPGGRAAVPPCQLCGGPRTFECQLMPNVLSVLTTSKHVENHATEPSRQTASKGPNADVPLSQLWQTDLGMEFGTVLIYVCERDCHVVAGVGETARNVGYFEEVALVQLEHT